jgi:hypothetical protein
LKNADIEAKDELDKQPKRRGRAIRIRLPRGRHASPWTSRVLGVVSLVGLVLLVPLWLDPVTLNQLRNVTPAPRPTTSAQAAVLVPALPTVGAPVSTVAQDYFERDVAAGWGLADMGGQYEVTGESERLSVTDGAAMVQLVPGQEGEALLPHTDAGHLDMTLLIDPSTRPSSGDAQVALVLRRLEDGSQYRATLHLSATNSASVSVEARSPTETRTIAGPIVVPGAGVGLMRIRATVEGSDPATIRMRAWMAYDAEPAYWHVSVIDWTGSLQAEGSLGIAWGLDPGPSSPSITLRFDDLLATSSDEVVR